MSAGLAQTIVVVVRIVTVTAGVVSRMTLLQRVGDEQVARGVHGDACGAAVVRRRSRARCRRCNPGPVAGDGDDVAGGLDDLADHVVARVGDEQVARGVDGDALGIVQLGVGRGPVVAAVTRGTVAGDGDDVAGRLDHLANDVVECCRR